MRITIHRGLDQIGGCITEIATKNNRIIIDLGHNLSDDEDTLANKESIEDLTQEVDAIFYTHYHGDHIDLFRYVPDNIKQYIGNTAKKVIQCKYRQLSRISPKGEKYGALLSKIEQMLPLKEGSRVQVGDISITPFFVSHSAYEAYMFLIESEGKRILHTGDFRDHGYLGKGLMKILERISSGSSIDALIIEGTMLSREGEVVKRESELQDDIFDVMSKYKNIFVLCSSTDMERLATFYAANKRIYNRPFIVDDYQKEILQIFSDSAGRKSSLFNFKKVFDFKEENEKLLKYMEDKGFCMLVRPTDKFSDYYRFIDQHINKEETVLIYSMWQMYINPKSRYQKANYINFVNQFPAIKKVHTSGHTSWTCLEDVCRLVNPSKAIIPIHTEQTENFSLLNIPDSLKDKVIRTATIQI